MPKLSIGMACFDDADRLWATIEAIRTKCIKEVQSSMPDWEFEFVVVDNKPAPPGYANKTKMFCDSIAHKGIRYIPMPAPVGTTQSRNRIFTEAQGEYVLAIDCHIQLHFGALKSLINYFETYPDTQNLLQGPIVWDDLELSATHMANYWRSHMWGIWSTAWVTGDSQLVDVIMNAEGYCEFRSVDMLSKRIDVGYIGKPIKWEGHQRYLKDHLGWKPASEVGDFVFDIPGQGLGLFACRKDAWLGFNADFRDFGGEEMYIHEKFRQAGRKCLCLSELKWTHHFGPPQGATLYPNTIYGKTRNYVIGHMELGRPVSEVYNHFVSLAYKESTLEEHLVLEHSITRESFIDPKTRQKVSQAQLIELHADPKHKMPESHWTHLIADPIKNEKPPVQNSLLSSLNTKIIETPEAVYMRYCNTPRDLDKHLPRLKDLADRCNHVTEISKRKESFAALAVSKAAVVKSYNIELGMNEFKLIAGQGERIGQNIEWFNFKPKDRIAPTDLLFIDSEHTAKCLSAELALHAPHVSRFIVLHDTESYWKQGEDGGEGLYFALRPFMENPNNDKWFICFTTPEEFGLTVLSCNPEDRPELPVRMWSPGYGPGTELKSLLKSFNIVNLPNCDCDGKAEMMDKWGVEGCVINREVIVGWLKEGYRRWGWAALTDNQSYLSVAWKAFTGGVAFKINPLDPWHSIVDICIDRARAKQ